MARSRRFSFRQFAAVVITGAFVGWMLCLGAIVFWSRGSAEGQADAIVVLGAAQYGGRPSPVLRARLDHALQLWKAGRAPRIMLTGGRKPGDQVSEAAAGRRYLMRRGVPTVSILLEPSGRTSLASMKGASSLLGSLRDSLGTSPRVLLVSDPFHMLRLDLLARLHGLKPMPSPTRTSPISANKAVIEYMVRESIAIPTDLALMFWLGVTGRELVDS